MFGIDELSSKYDQVVFDSSALQADSSIDKEYRPKIMFALDDKKFGTVEDIVFETYTWLKDASDPLYVRVKSRQRELEGVAWHRHRQFFSHLVPTAKKLGILDRHKHRPYADIKLAAFALTLACEYQNVAFVSADRRLNFLLDTQRKGRLPQSINSIDVLSFVKHSGRCMRYEEERHNHGSGYIQIKY